MCVVGRWWGERGWCACVGVCEGGGYADETARGRPSPLALAHTNWAAVSPARAPVLRPRQSTHAHAHPVPVFTHALSLHSVQLSFPSAPPEGCAAACLSLLACFFSLQPTPPTMPPTTACCAHDHDCEAADCGPAWSLHTKVHADRVRALNAAPPARPAALLRPWAARSVAGVPPLVSDDDDPPELLVHIPFDGLVRITAIAVVGLGEVDGGGGGGGGGATTTATPATLRAFVNRDGLGFDEAAAGEPAQEWELVAGVAGAAVEYPTRCVCVRRQGGVGEGGTPSTTPKPNPLLRTSRATLPFPLNTHTRQRHPLLRRPHPGPPLPGHGVQRPRSHRLHRLQGHLAAGAARGGSRGVRERAPGGRPQGAQGSGVWAVGYVGRLRPCPHTRRGREGACLEEAWALAGDAGPGVRACPAFS